MNELLRFSAARLACLIRERKVSAAEVMEAHIAHIAEVNGEINAVVELLAESARAQARLADDAVARGAQLGPFHGVPFSVKDSLEVARTRCTAGTVGRRTAPLSTEDAAVVARLRRAGAIPIAKTNLPDL
ncbi:MAG: hypothetical protein JO336_07660, partial [Acidobacteriia bacterium]|nr:hypothetical protein [Terriglobia bacterium]